MRGHTKPGKSQRRRARIDLPDAEEDEERDVLDILGNQGDKGEDVHQARNHEHMDAQDYANADEREGFEDHEHEADADANTDAVANAEDAMLADVTRDTEDGAGVDADVEDGDNDDAAADEEDDDWDVGIEAVDEELDVEEQGTGQSSRPSKGKVSRWCRHLQSTHHWPRVTLAPRHTATGSINFCLPRLMSCSKRAGNTSRCFLK